MYGSVALLLAALGLALAAPQSSSISVGASSLTCGTRGTTLQAGTNMAKTDVSIAAEQRAPTPVTYQTYGRAPVKKAGFNGLLDMATGVVETGVRGVLAVEGAKLGLAQQGLSSLLGGGDC